VIVPLSPGLASGLFLRSANVTSVALDKAKPPTFYRDSLTHTGKCHGTISARPELSSCGNAPSAIREGPRLSPGLASGLFLRSARQYARLAANGTSCHPTSAPHATRPT